MMNEFRLALLCMAAMAAPVCAQMAGQAPAVQRYSLSSDALFGFGRSTLDRAGEAKLDELVDRLRDVHIDRITGTGHSDRIGSPEINQKVSESRAESVKAYLVSKGIQFDRISAVGRGDRQPVTSSNACPGPAKRDVIACLQPDRRVDIEVVGTGR